MSNALGDYLRARRAQVSPDAVGMPRGRRRVAGLRREELAVLAGVSPDYYTRVEQGRDRNPSTQVLDAIGRVLRLDGEAMAHLHELGRAAAGAPTAAPGLDDEVPDGLRSWLRQLPFPAFVQDRVMTVVAANSLAAALSPHFTVGTNLVRAVFLDPGARTLHADWERASQEAVSGLRSLAGARLDDPALTSLVDELGAASPRFRALWERQDVRAKVGGTSEWVHPDVGAMTLGFEKLAVNGSDGHLLVVYHAEPGTPSHDALQRLVPADPEHPSSPARG
ncbi:helix-turn-helix transcriptional regulator [Phycicoccus sp. DTK01]|uniref:helix-turn-helix transcriptional regulator n=1 Tax=Phycicoccus sp. DTK01 TaxID=2785745 RepID=UPI001AA41EE4|nr:helix-turn-helix transcriptional regulator [Phycicoccus sp. DTK01]GIL36727.1 transcriptional regulator [Phycicoccus sp. DTK01]